MLWSCGIMAAFRAQENYWDIQSAAQVLFRGVFLLTLFGAYPHVRVLLADDPQERPKQYTHVVRSKSESEVVRITLPSTEPGKKIRA